MVKGLSEMRPGLLNDLMYGRELKFRGFDVIVRSDDSCGQDYTFTLHDKKANMRISNHFDHRLLYEQNAEELILRELAVSARTLANEVFKRQNEDMCNSKFNGKVVNTMNSHHSHTAAPCYPTSTNYTLQAFHSDIRQLKTSVDANKKKPVVLSLHDELQKSTDIWLEGVVPC